MTTTRFADLLTALVGAPSIEEGLARTLRRVVTLTGAAAGAVVFSPPHAKPIAATAGPRALTRDPAGRRVVQIPLGASTRPVGRLTLVGRGRALRRAALPPGFGRELGTAIEQVWQRQRRTLRTTILTEITRLLGSSDSLDDVLSAFANGLARLVDFDAVAVSLLDAERGEFEVLDVTARTVPGRIARDVRLPLEHTLLERDVASVLDRISRSVSALIGSTGCGIGLLDSTGARLVHAAAHGYKSEEWRALALPVGEGLMGRCAEIGQPIRVDDVRRDPRSARRDVDEREGIRSMLCVPLRVGGPLLGVISAFSTRPAAFSVHHQRVLEAFAEQAGISIQNAQLFEQSVHRARETRALLEAGRAVTASLDLERTIHVIMEQAKAVLGVHSCGVMLKHPETGVLSSVASLDLPEELVATVRIRPGEGVTGRAVADGRPMWTADLWNDPRVRYPELPRAQGLRSLLAAPLRVGDGTIGAIIVLRRDVHEFSVGGDGRVVQLTVAPLAGAAAHVVLLVADVTRAKQLERQMLLTERLTTAGRLAAGVAHELNNPLATIAGCAEALSARLVESGLADRPELADFRGYLRLIEEEAFRCKEITGSLLQFVREPGDRRAPTDLNAVVQKTIELLSHQSRFAGSRFVTEQADDLPEVLINEGQFRQVFLGVASNGLEAMEGRGRLIIRTRAIRDEVEVEFEDEGPGVAEEILGRIFDPFFTTKPPGQGTGLGLAIAQGIVADHGGRIEVQSRPGKGSVFRVVVPAGRHPLP